MDTNENTNGVVKEYTPCALQTVAKGDVKVMRDAINMRLCKRRGFRTIYEIHLSKVLRSL